jgi:hypothetical protein
MVPSTPAPSCASTNGLINFSNGGKTELHVITLAYTPCHFNATGGTGILAGKIYSGTLKMTEGARFRAPPTPPGVTGGGQAASSGGGAATVNILYEREG